MTDDRDFLDGALADRLRSGVSGITPRHDAAAVVRHHVGRRRRRRRVVGAVASVAAVAVVVPAALVALQLTSGDRDVAPADPVPTTETFDGTRPTAFFVQQVGGRGSAQLIRYRAAPTERYHARFRWWPEVDAERPVFGGAAVESFEGTPAEACAALVEVNETEDPLAVASCTTTSDGQVVRVIETTSNGHRIDPLNRRARLDNADPDDAVFAATVFREDGWAVTLSLCACRAWGADDLPEPPLTTAQLAEAAADPDWVPDP